MTCKRYGIVAAVVTVLLAAVLGGCGASELPSLTIRGRETGDFAGDPGTVWVNTLDDVSAQLLTPSEDGTLPVFTHQPVTDDAETLRQRILRVGELLGMGEDAVLTSQDETYVAYTPQLYGYRLEDERFMLEANRDSLAVTVTLREGIPFPSDFVFEEKYRLTRAEWETLTPFLTDVCKDTLGLTSPVATIEVIGAYSSGREDAYIRFCQDGGLTFEFSYLHGTALQQCAAYLPEELLGEYPVIAQDEAYARLLDGHYLGASGYGEDSPKPEERVDLILYADMWQTVKMPCYRFFVYSHSFPKDGAEGEIKVYNVYHVPAVHDDYLTALPQDGQAVVETKK